MFSCLALDQIRSEWSLTNIIDHGLKHIRLNASKDGNPIGNFYNNFGTKEAEGGNFKNN